MVYTKKFRALRVKGGEKASKGVEEALKGNGYA